MDNLYQEPALIEIYDAMNASREDVNFYINLLPDTPARVLDIGCGTGTLALELARCGHSVIGVDPAPGMIAAARTKQYSETVEWIAGHISNVPSFVKVDIAIMTGHAFQCLLRDTEIAALFRSVSTHLDRGGSFWFETRNPAAQAWKKWTPQHARPAIDLTGGRRVQVVHHLLEVEGEYVTFEETYDITGLSDPLTSRSTLRFPPMDKIQNLANANGLIVKDAFGDWEMNEFNQTSPEMILSLEKAH